MVKRVESQVTFEAQPQSVYLVNEMPPEVQDATDCVLSEMITRHEFKWVPGSGVGGYQGLSERITHKFAPVAPECIPGCDLDVEVQAYDGTAANASILLVCSQICEKDEKRAESLEARCLANHQATKEAFAKFVTTTAASVASAAERLSQAKALVNAEDHVISELL